MFVLLLAAATLRATDAFEVQVGRLSGIALTRIAPDPLLPTIFEVDWSAQQGLDDHELLNGHDPLSSCYWPASMPLARLLYRSSESLRRKSVVEIGCGTGLCSLTCASVGAKVLATDVDPLALELTAAAASAQALNVDTVAFDATHAAEPLPCADVLLMSDLFVTEALARAHASRVAEALTSGAYQLIVVVDPARQTRADFLEELSRQGIDGHHRGFQPLDESTVLNLEGSASGVSDGRKLVLLDTEVGAAVSYDI